MVINEKIYRLYSGCTLYRLLSVFGIDGSEYSNVNGFGMAYMFWLSAFFLHKGLFWGGIFGLFPAINMIYMGTQYTGQVINIEIPLGIILILFYGIFGFYLWKKRNDIPKAENKEIVIMVIKVALTLAVILRFFCICAKMI